ncbi:MAG: WYL domain-containing protein [Egibacteraceae bacterium]
MGGVAALELDRVREALRRFGVGEPPGSRAAAHRALRDILRGYGTVRSALDRAPEGARAAFVRLAQDGATSVEDLLGRGWWGHGTLPPPLDWLQHRALAHVEDSGLVAVVDEAREGFSELTLDLEPSPDEASRPLRVEPAGCVVVAAQPGLLDRALTVAAADLRALTATVAVSSRSSAQVNAALRSAGVRLAEDEAVAGTVGEPALPGTAEDALGPRLIRTLLERAVGEGRQVHLEYYASSRGGAATERTVDPWSFGEDLLRGYCHLRAGERTFAVDRIGHARLLPSPVEVPPPPAG